VVDGLAVAGRGRLTAIAGPSVACGPRSTDDSVASRMPSSTSFGDEHHGLPVLLPDAFDFMQAAAVNASSARQRFVEQQGSADPSPARGATERAVSCRRKVPRRWSRAGVRFTMAMYFSTCRCFRAGPVLGKSCRKPREGCFRGRSARAGANKEATPHPEGAGDVQSIEGELPPSGWISPAMSEIRVVCPRREPTTPQNSPSLRTN